MAESTAATANYYNCHMILTVLPTAYFSYCYSRGYSNFLKCAFMCLVEIRHIDLY